MLLDLSLLKLFARTKNFNPNLKEKLIRSSMGMILWFISIILAS